MRVFSLSISILLLFIIACSPNKQTSSGGATSSTESTPIRSVTQDGTSFKRAVVITQTSTTTGIRAENQWIREHYPGMRKIQQRLVEKSKKPYDIITIEDEKGKKIDVYFDISRFFGKF